MFHVNVHNITYTITVYVITLVLVAYCSTKIVTTMIRDYTSFLDNHSHFTQCPFNSDKGEDILI